MPGPDAAARATDFSWKMVGLSTAYATLWGIDKGLEKISFDLIGVQPIMNWVAEDLKEAIMTAAVEQAVLHGIDYSENHLAGFLSRFKVPDHVTRSAMGAAHGFVEEVGVDTAAQVGVAGIAALKAGGWGAMKGAGQGAVGGFVAGGPLGAIGGAVVGGLAQGVWEGAKEGIIMGASSPDAIAALNVSGAEWLLGEFATYMDVHREGAWRQLDDVIDKPLKARGISSEKFWGGDLVRRFMKGTIKFLIKHTIVEKYKKTDYESRRRAMQYRLAIYAFNKCSSLGGTITDLWGSTVDKMGELSELFKRTKDEGLDWKTTLEYKYSFIGDDTNIDQLKALLESLEEDEDKLREKIAEHQGRIRGNLKNRKRLEAEIFEKYGEDGSKIDKSEKNKAKAYEKAKAELKTLNDTIEADQKALEELVANLDKVTQKQVAKAKELEKAIEAYCGVSTKDVKAARQTVAQHKLAIMEADHFIDIFQGYIDEQALLLKELNAAEAKLKEARRELDKAKKDVKQNQKSGKTKETVARSKAKEAEIKARVDFLQKHIRSDFNIKDKSEKGGTENVRKVIANLEAEIKTLEREKKEARKALPKAEAALAVEEEKFKKAMAGAVAKQVAQCTKLADDCVAQSKNIIRLGMLVRDGYLEKEDYEQCISMIRLKCSELADKDPRKDAFEKVISDFSYENLFAVGHRNTSTEIEKDGKLTVHVFNTDIHGLDPASDAEAEIAFNQNLATRFGEELTDTTLVEGNDTDENDPVTLPVASDFVSQVNAGNQFKLELSMKDDNPRVSGRLEVMDGFVGTMPDYRPMTESEKVVEKLRVMTGGDELMVAKATQILNRETAEAVLAPLKQAIIEGRNETGFDTKMILKDEDNPEYIFQVGETPGQDALVITVTARWEIEGHETGDRKHTISGEKPSTVEANTQFVIKQGELIKVKAFQETTTEPGFFGKLLGAQTQTTTREVLVDERQSPTCEFKSCTVIRAIYDDLVVEDLGLGKVHPEAPKPKETVVVIDQKESVVSGSDVSSDQKQPVDESEKAAQIAEEIQVDPKLDPKKTDPVIIDIEPSSILEKEKEKEARHTTAVSALRATMQGMPKDSVDAAPAGDFYTTFGTIETVNITEVEGYNYLLDISDAVIDAMKENESKITFSIEDSDGRLKGGALEKDDETNALMAPIIEKLHVMSNGDIKAMKVAMQCLTPGAADMLFTDEVKTAIANGRELTGDPTYSFDVIEVNGELKIKATATWDVEGSNEKAEGTVEFFLRNGGTKQVPVEKEIEKKGTGGWGWTGWSEPEKEIISVFETQKQPPTLELVGLTVE